MAEVAAIIGLIASIASLVELSAKVVSRLHELTSKTSEIPESFRSLSIRLPLLTATLQRIQTHTEAGRLPIDVTNSLKAVVDNTSEQISAIHIYLSKVLPSDGASKLERAIKALKSLAKDDKVQQALEKIHKNNDILVLHQTTRHVDTGDRILEELAKLSMAPRVSAKSFGVCQGQAPQINICDIQQESTIQISHRMSCMQSSLQLKLSQIRASNDLLQDKMNATVRASSAIEATSAMTANQIAQIDNRIAQLQLQTQASIDAKRPPSPAVAQPRRRSRRSHFRLHARTGRLELVGLDYRDANPPNEQAVTQHIVNIVDTAILVKERRGKQTHQLIAAKDSDYESLSISQKKTMVQYLQSLRLLLWLLRKKNVLMSSQLPVLCTARSLLAREASISSLAVFSMSYSALDMALADQSLVLETALPWLKWKFWLQYLFDRVEDRTRDGDRIMNMILTQWRRMPVPDSGAAAYYLPIPAHSFRTGLCSHCGSMPNRSDQSCLHCWASWGSDSRRPRYFQLTWPLQEELLSQRTLKGYHYALALCSSALTLAEALIGLSWNPICATSGEPPGTSKPGA